MNVLLLLAVSSTLLVSLCCTTTNVVAHNPSFNAIYQFGDSLSDTGNSVQLGPNAGCGSLPYGQTFFHHASGRCSDGLLMVDYFAQAFDLPLLSAYLNKSGDFKHGANFAVAGATALNTSFAAASSLLVQLGWFTSHLAAICCHPDDYKQKLENALFIVGEIGGNDYFFGAFVHKSPKQLRSIVPDVVQVITSVVKELIRLGAKHIIVPGGFPAGCWTVYLDLYKTDDPSAYDELGCLKEWNDLTEYHNGQLQDALTAVQQQNSGVSLMYGDYYSTYISLLRLGPYQGFEKDGLYKACCGSGGGDYNFDSTRLCGSNGATVCAQPSVRISWDGIHLTQHANLYMAKQLLKQIKYKPYLSS